jgi:hypothetical protein
LSLVEALVGSAVLLLVSVVALTVYEAARRSFSVGEDAAELQQSVRTGFDRLVADLRRAGLNHNPDGDPDRPDEPIEGAFVTAVVLRADFDGADPGEASDPEDRLSGSAHEVVSTGNDEIVAWFLAKSDGSSTATLTFEADVADEPRDGSVESVAIANVALVHDDPPYTLYRATLDNDVAGHGTGAFVTRTPVADNIASVRFDYFDAAGLSVGAVGGAETSRPARHRIDRIRVRLAGASETGRRGRLSLEGDVRSRNAGTAGRRDAAAP